MASHGELKNVATKWLRT